MKYYLHRDKQPETDGGHYEIHKSNCIYYIFYKGHGNFIELGSFSSDIDALNYAKNTYTTYAPDIDGCKRCCSSINSD